jgi:hypothetical protein
MDKNAPDAGDPALPLEDLTFETDKRADLAVTLAVFAAGAFIVWEASGFRTGSFPDPVTARGLPYFTGTFMMLGALITAARRIQTWHVIPGHFTVTEGSPDEPGHPASAVRAFANVGLALVWAVLLHAVGFLILTPLVAFAMLWTMEVRSWPKLVGFPLAITAIIWLTFAQVLNVALPLGPLTTALRAWGLTP